MRARFIAAARREFLAEVVYYNKEEPGLGARFAAAVEDATDRALAFPLAGAPASKNTRRVFSQGLSFRCCLSARCRRYYHLCTRTSLASAGLLAIAWSGPLTNHSSPTGCAGG